MLTSNSTPGCSTAKSAGSVERGILESGWTDYFSWADDLWDSDDLTTGAKSTGCSTQSRLCADLQASSTCSLISIDARLAKEARECLIADHIAGSIAACRMRNVTALRGHNKQQCPKAHAVHTKLFDHFADDDLVGCIAATSIASVASSGPASSSLLMCYALDKSLLHSTDRHSESKCNSQMPAMRLDMENHSRSCCKRVRTAHAVNGLALQDTCSKTRRIAMQSKFHRSSSSATSHDPPLISISGLEWSAEAACSRSHEGRAQQEIIVQGDMKHTTSFGG